MAKRNREAGPKPAVCCPKCGHSFIPPVDADLEGWSRRNGREPWNRSSSAFGWYRRVRDFVVVVNARKKAFSRAVEFWEWSVVPFDRDLELARPGLGSFWQIARTKVEGQKLGLERARLLVEQERLGTVVRVWAHCEHGRTDRREATGHVGDHVPVCIDCALEEQQRELEEQREREKWRREQEAREIARKAEERRSGGAL